MSNAENIFLSMFSGIDTAKYEPISDQITNAHAIIATIFKSTYQRL